MPNYRFHYQQTEYRHFDTTADDPAEAVAKYINGEGCDSFDATDEQSKITAVYKLQSGGDFQIVLDPLVALNDQFDIAEAAWTYVLLREKRLCQDIPVFQTPIESRAQ